MIGAEPRCSLQRTRIGTRVSPRLPARITKADIGSAVLQFISQRSAASKKKERLRRSRQRACRKSPGLNRPRQSAQIRGEIFLPKAPRRVFARTPSGLIDSREKCCAL